MKRQLNFKQFIIIILLASFFANWLVSGHPQHPTDMRMMCIFLIISALVSIGIAIIATKWNKVKARRLLPLYLFSGVSIIGSIICMTMFHLDAERYMDVHGYCRFFTPQGLIPLFLKASVMANIILIMCLLFDRYKVKREENKTA